MEKRKSKIEKFNLAKIFLFLSLVLLFLIVLLSCSNRHKQEQPFVTSPLKFIHINNSVYLLFNVSNSENLPAVCNVSLYVENYKSYNVRLGYLNPLDTNSFLVQLHIPNGKYEVKVTPKCTFVNRSWIVESANTFVNKTGFSSCLSNDAGQSFFCLAFLERNLSLCNFIPSNYKRVLCYAYATHDSNFCGDLLNSSDADLCFEDLAVNWKDLNLCGKISNLSIANSCSAIVKNNLSQCLSVHSAKQKDYCVIMLSIKNRNLSICRYSYNVSSCEIQAKNSFE